MKSPVSEFEREAHELLTTLVERRQRTFDSVGARVQILDIRRSAELGSTYDAEIGAYFWLNAKLVDAIEVFVVRGGQPATDLAVLSKWLESALDEVQVKFAATRDE